MRSEMAAEGRLEAEIVLKSPDHKFFQRLSKETDNLPDDAVSDKVHGVEVHEGDFKTHGSIKSWSYILDGKKEVLKEKFEIDEENMTVRMVAVDGHLLERLKSYKIIHKVISKPNGVVALITTLVYEKTDDQSDWEPIKELEFLIGTMKHIDNHLIEQQ